MGSSHTVATVCALSSSTKAGQQELSYNPRERVFWKQLIGVIASINSFGQQSLNLLLVSNISDPLSRTSYLSAEL